MSALSKTIEWFQAETFSRSKELERLNAETRNRITVDQRNVAKSSYKALQSLDHLVWDFVRFDNSLLACRRQWTITKIVLMAAGFWQSFENRTSHGHKSLHRSTRQVERAWSAASTISEVAFDRAMALSLEVSLLRDNLATQQEHLNAAIEEWECTFSQAHEVLAKHSASMEITKKEFHAAKRKLDDAEMYKQISDIKHTFIQGFFGAVREAADERRQSDILPNPVAFLFSVASGAAEAASKRGQAEYSLSFGQEKEMLEAKMESHTTEINDVQAKINKLEADHKTYTYYKPQLRNWQTITANMGNKIHTLQKEMALHKNTSMQTSISVQDVLAKWEVIRYSKVREDVLAVLGSVLQAIEEDGALILLHGSRGLRLYKSLRLGTEWLEFRTEMIESLDDETDDSWLLEVSSLLTSSCYFFVCMCIIAAFVLDFWMVE